MKAVRFNPVIPDPHALSARIGAMLSRICFCTVCKRRQAVDPATCLARGWPMCCGRTMHSEARLR